MKPLLKLLLFGVCFCALLPKSFALGQPAYVETVKSKDSFTLAQGGQAASRFVDAGDYPGVRRAAADLQQDIARVTGRTPALLRARKAPEPTPSSSGRLAKVL